MATPVITDPNFVHTVVYVYAAAPDEGAAGVVLNRPSDVPAVDHLPEWRSILADPPAAFWGGPVAPESGIVLIVSDDEVVVADEVEPPSGPAQARLFVGQAGWGRGQLEGEVAEAAWLVVDGRPEDIVTSLPDSLWSAVLRRHGAPRLWATHPVDASWN